MLNLSLICRVAATVVLSAAFAVAAVLHAAQPAAATPGCTDTWSSPGNGNWTDAPSWSNGFVPVSTDDVCLPAGSYVVSLNTDATIHSLNISGATLQVAGLGCVANASLTVTTDIANTGSLTLSNVDGTCTAGQRDTVSWGGTLTNSGTVNSIPGSGGGLRFLNGNLNNLSTLNVLISTDFGGSFAVLNNAGVTNVANGAVLTDSNGTFTNTGPVVTSGSGTLSISSGTFNQGANAAGSNPITLYSSTLNLNGAGPGNFVYISDGNLTGSVASTQQLTIESRGGTSNSNVVAPGSFTNAGSITLTNVPGNSNSGQNVYLTWSGTLTNTGTLITTFGVGGGTRHLRGSLTNDGGTLSVGADTYYDGSGAVFNNNSNATVNVTSGGLTFNNSANASNNGAFSLADASHLSVMSSSFNNVSGIIGAGSASISLYASTFSQGANPAGNNPVTMDVSTLNLNGAGTGAFVFVSSGTLTGNVAASQQLTIEGRGGTNNTTVTAPGSFTNAGTITLSNIGSAADANLDWAGTLTNNDTISSVFGASGGARNLQGSLANTSTLNILTSTNFNGSFAVLSNTGTTNIGTGATLTMYGTTFTNIGSVVTAGTGAISMVNGTFNQGSNSAGFSPVSLDGSTLNLNNGGAGTFVFFSGGTLTGNVAAGQQLTIEGRGGINNTTVTAPTSFTNAGTITLTNIGSAANATLSWTGTLTNNGSISSVPGMSGGSRNLSGSLANMATLNIVTSTTYSASSAVLTNSGTTNIGSGAILTMYGTTFTNSGSIATNATGTISMVNGIFNQGAGSAGLNPVSLDGSNLNLNGGGAGNFVFMSGGTLTGNIASTQQLTIEGRGGINNTTVTAPASFTNAGAITLTNVPGNSNAGQDATLIWTGTLTNSGTMSSIAGTGGGSRNLSGNLTNSGTLNILMATNFNTGFAVLTNKKTLVIGTGAILSVNNSTLTNLGTITTAGTGYVAMSNGTFNQGAKPAGTNNATLSGSTLNLTGAGAGGWVFVNNGNLSGNVGTNQRVTIESQGGTSNTTVQAAAAFTNGGTITLTNVPGNSSAGQNTVLTWPGTLTNNGTISSIFGTGGGFRDLQGSLVNAGTINILTPTSFDATSATLTNARTLKLAAGATLSMSSSQSYTQQASGTFEPGIDATVGQGQLLGAGSATLAGTLKVDTTGEPASGNVYPLIGAGTLSGTFATLNFQLEGYVVSYSSTQATILVDAEPSITSLSKKALVQGSMNKVITVTGANFTPSITATFSGAGITINNFAFVSSTKLSVTVSVSGTAPVGAQMFTVTNPDQGAAAIKFTVDPPPVPSGASPNALGQGATAETVLVSGTGFVARDKASFSGTGVTVNSTTVVSPTQLSLSVTVSATAATGLRSITVSNSDGGVGTCTNCLTVDAGPTATGASPSSVARGTNNQNVVITGTNFVNGATASFSASGITINSVIWNSATQITVNISVSATATTGACTITVVNPDHGQGSSSTVFSIT